MAAQRTNLGSLLTTFTPPVACTSVFYPPNCSNCPEFHQGQSCSGSDPVDDPDCWPPRTNSQQPTPSGFLNGWGYYSPGLYCPSGYYSACSATGSNGDYSFKFAPLSTETAIGCCPTGYQCGTTLVYTEMVTLQACQAHVTHTTIALSTCNAGKMSPSTTISVPDNGINTLDAYAPMIQLIRKEGDLSRHPTSASTQATLSGSPPPAATSSQLSVPSLKPEPRPGLSKGAKAGIAVGVFLGFFAILGAVIYLFHTKRNKRSESAVELDTTTQGTAQEKTQATSQIHELPADGRHEMFASVPSVHELP